MSLAKKIIAFNRGLQLNVELPPGFHVMNPFRGEQSVVIDRITDEFYHKFFNDSLPRTLIIGINPGRLGAGLTGIPFTDTKRLVADCGIQINEFASHEPSSVFIYKVIAAMGGPEAFYLKYLFTSACLLGFLLEKNGGKVVNANYYDSKDLYRVVKPFIVKTLRQTVEFTGRTDRAFVLGNGQNFKFLTSINQEERIFERLIALEHPRFIMQYRSKQVERYVDEFASKLSDV